VDPTVGIFAGGSQHPGSSQAIECGEQLLELDGMLEELFRLSPRQAEIFESRFFAGLSVPETAAALNISESSVERDYRSAKAWLAGKIRPAKKG
jgi:RNA polymerase sigma factor (sigma-70 family)